jgi:DNA-binding NtrC family response regulator
MSQGEPPVRDDEILARHHSTVIHPRRSRLKPLPVSIQVIGVRAQPNPLRLEEGVLVVGAGREADVVIESDSVSRRHAELRLVPEGVSVRDLDSKNGSYYANQRFQSMILHPGARFRAGDVEIEISLDYQALGERAADEAESYGDLIGVSPSMRQLFAKLVRLEGSKVNVLIVGESGTGKELVARAIHEHSSVRHGPMVVFNCGALDRQLVRSELFGHERGAFTGAVRRHVGAFESAHGGTLFLDEIAELPLDIQPVILRALEQRRIAPVGATEERAVDVRVIAATHRNLTEQVRAGQFREDLYYRIRVVELGVPPLRERAEDVAVLAQEFAFRQGLSALPDDVLEALGRHQWPGNVRELRNAVEAYAAVGALPRAESSAESARGLDAALAAFVDATETYADQKAEVLRRFTRAYLDRLLENAAGNQSEAARVSGLERSYLGKLLDKLGMKPNRG